MLQADFLNALFVILCTLLPLMFVGYKHRSVIANANGLLQSTAADTTFHNISENNFPYIFQILKPCGWRDLELLGF